MRVSTSWAQQLSLNSLLNQQAAMTKTQQQLSTGLKNLSPADDPVAAKQALNLQSTIDKTTQFQRNIDVVVERNNLEETALSSSENLLFRAKELVVQAKNLSLNKDDRNAIKYEVDQLLNGLVGLANTKNANGEYIFSGDFSQVEPFKWNAGTESFDYQGGINQRVLDIDLNRQIADGDLGDTVFHNIASSSQSATVTADNQRSIFNTLKDFSQALDASYDIPEGRVTGDSFLRYGKDYSSGAVAFDLAVDGAGAVSVSIAGAAYNSLDDLVTAVNSGISASALTGTVKAQVSGNNIEFISLTKGSGSSVAISNDTNGVLTDFGFEAIGESSIGVDLGGSIIGSSPLQTDFSTDPVKFQLNANSGTPVSITLNANYVTPAAVVSAINSQITAIPAEMGAKIAANGSSIEFFSISNGGASTIQVKNEVGDFLEDQGFDEGQTGYLYDVITDEVLSDLDAALDSFLQARSKVGSRLQTLDSQEIHHEAYMLDMKTLLSEVKDIDYTEAITRFNLESTALQAAQQSYSRVQNLSLFNFL